MRFNSFLLTCCCSHALNHTNTLTTDQPAVSQWKERRFPRAWKIQCDPEPGRDVYFRPPCINFHRGSQEKVRAFPLRCIRNKKRTPARPETVSQYETNRFETRNSFAIGTRNRSDSLSAAGQVVVASVAFLSVNGLRPAAPGSLWRSKGGDRKTCTEKSLHS